MANEMRLIDANILKTLFDVRYDTAFIQEHTRENKEQWKGYCTGINWGRNTIADAPTVDARPVVHGRWEKEDQSGISIDGYMVCSACNVMIPKPDYNRYCLHRLNFCPNCGADMRGDRDGRKDP